MNSEWAAAARKLVDSLADETREPILLADGMEDALLGLVSRFGTPTIALYDRRKCIEILCRQGMSLEEAEEFFEFNIIGAYVGPYTPAFAIFPEGVGAVAATAPFLAQCDEKSGIDQCRLPAGHQMHKGNGVSWEPIGDEIGWRLARNEGYIAGLEDALAMVRRASVEPSMSDYIERLKARLEERKHGE